MSDYSIDAIKIAKVIQKDELSILRGKEFKMRNRIKKRKRMKKTSKKNKYTLNGLDSKIDKLSKRVNQVVLTFDKLVVTVAILAKTVDDGFKQVNTRLDYVVSANNLKDLPKKQKDLKIYIYYVNIKNS